jgi:hypothetical protein
MQYLRGCRRTLLDRKRKEQEERRRQQEELERILAENARKVEEAQQRAAKEREEREDGRCAAAAALPVALCLPAGVRPACGARFVAEYAAVPRSKHLKRTWPALTGERRL